jgi:hypothetical protein
MPLEAQRGVEIWFYPSPILTAHWSGYFSKGSTSKKSLGHTDLVDWLSGYFTGQSQPWEPCTYSASAGIPRILRLSEVHNHTHCSFLIFSILTRMNPVDALPFHLFNIHFNVIPPSTHSSFKWSLSLRFCPPPKFCIVLRRVFRMQNATISFVMSVRLSAWNNPAPTGRIFMKFDDFSNIYIDKMQVSFKSDNNNGYFTWRPMDIYDISLNSS